jgi:trypsin
LSILFERATYLATRMSYRHGFAIALLFLQGTTVWCVDLGSILKEKEGHETGNDSRIVGGHDAEKGRYPSIVAMFDAHGFFQCGGTLILPDVVLSAAHCLPHAVRVEVGRHNIYKTVLEENAESFDIATKLANPNYGKTSLYQNDMDFALFKLSGNGAVHAKTATLNGDSNFPGNREKIITVAGWGTTSEGGALANVLQEVGVKCMPNDRCREKFRAYKNALTDDMMCASVDGGGKVR